MDFGIGYFPTHDGVSPGALARLVEERGHESLFFPEHTHIPASRATPYPAGGDLPRKYFHTYDLFVALTAAAAATSKLRIAAVLPRAHAHPGEPRDPLPGRRRPPAKILPHV